MKKELVELEDQGLKWVQTSGWKQNYELQDEHGAVIATMHRPSMWSSRVEVTAPGNHWAFERKGWFRQRVIIRSVGTGEEPAQHIYRSTSGRLEYRDGRVFLWKQGNFWGTKWMWTTEDGEPLIGFQTKGFLKIGSEINLNSDLASDKVPSLLIFLGWYLYTLYHEDSTAAVVAAT
jgi:hypothetical protein